MVRSKNRGRLIVSPRKHFSRRSPRSGFALVITLVLLALLVLAIYALSALTRVGTDIAATAAYQTQARQNALLGFRSALGELQRLAGNDDVHTGMAGIAGVGAGAGHPTRHWCGIWSAGGVLQGWLVSGADLSAVPVVDPGGSIAMLAEGALGADGTDKEYVRAWLLPVTLSSATGSVVQGGNLAWWAGDEGVKLSAVIPDADSPVPGQKHALSELISSLSPTAASLARVVSYAQLAYVPTIELTPGQLQSNLHALSRAHEKLGAVGTRQTGLLNVNTTTVRFWRGVAATYNLYRSPAASALTTATFAARLRDEIPLPDSGAGKPAGAPYANVEAFLGSAALAHALDASGGAVDDFAVVMRPWLTTRSDTFRVRAYGEALNPSDSTRVEATAWCEAILQRSADPLPGFGRRFVVTYFRWLGTDDI